MLLANFALCLATLGLGIILGRQLGGNPAKRTRKNRSKPAPEGQLENQ